MRNASLIALIAFLVASPLTSFAENPFRSNARVNSAYLVREAHTPAAFGRHFAPVKLSLRNMYGLGNVAIVLNKRKLPSAEACFVNAQGVCEKDRKVPVLFRGTATLMGRRAENRNVPVAASVIDNQVKVQFAGPALGSRKSHRRVFSVQFALSAKNDMKVRVASKPSAAFLGKDCGSEHTTHGAETRVAAASAIEPSVETYRVVTISTDADPEWYAQYGENSNVEIAAIINAAEAIYDRQMGIRFSIVRQHVYTTTSPYVETDASKLLASFAKNPENPANMGFAPLTFDQDVDLKHLFTGKNLDGNTVGLSYIGAICWASASAYGLTQNLSRVLNVAIFAHEIGHSLGAQHDSTDPSSLMYPNIGPKTYFSAASVSQINKLLASVGKCVADEQLRPNLVNASLTLKRSFSKDRKALKLKGQLLSASLKPIAGEVVRISLNAKIVLVMTDADGKFSLVLKTKKIKAKKLLVFAQTANSETAISGALKVSVPA